ncbi:MAG: hypothetical protein NVS1B1_11400 [Candidatus Limnocylindrales bacterium]
MDERAAKGDRGDQVRPDPQGERGGPADPTRKLLKVFGVKVTDYEARTDALLARWAAAAPAERSDIAREAAELSADLARWLREVQTHVLERQERVLAALSSR